MHAMYATKQNHTGVYDDDMHVCVCAFAGADWYV